MPIDLDSTIISSIHRVAYGNVKKLLGMEVEEVKLCDFVQQLPYLDEDLL